MPSDFESFHLFCVYFWLEDDEFAKNLNVAIDLIM